MSTIPKEGEAFSFTVLADWQAANKQANALGLMGRVDRVVDTREAWGVSGEWIRQPAAPSPVRGEPTGDGVEQAALDAFALWMQSQMPSGTEIADPSWWAPRVFRAALNAHRAARAAASSGERVTDADVAAVRKVYEREAIADPHHFGPDANTVIRKMLEAFLDGRAPSSGRADMSESATEWCRCKKPTPSVFVNHCLDCGEAIKGDPLLSAAAAERSEATDTIPRPAPAVPGPDRNIREWAVAEYQRHIDAKVHPHVAVRWLVDALRGCHPVPVSEEAADTKRLDWLEAEAMRVWNQSRFRKPGCALTYDNLILAGGHANIRAALDRAMNAGTPLSGRETSDDEGGAGECGVCELPKGDPRCTHGRRAPGSVGGEG